MIRRATLADAPAIAAIYNHYVAKTTITFEEEPVSVLEMTARIEEANSTLPWFVLESDDRLLGYTLASPWKSRCAYRYAVETTIYLQPGLTGKGWGTQLYQRLIEEMRQWKFHSLIGGIALPNPASERLHEKLGFKKIAHFHEVGWKFEKWIDVAYWQLIL